MKIYWLLLCLIILSCKSRQNASVIKDSTSSRETLVVLAGGFSSCPDVFVFDKAMRAGKTEEMYRMFWDKGIVSLIRTKTGDFPVIFSICYTGPDSLATDFTQSISGRYGWNIDKLNKGRGGVKTFGIPQGELFKNIDFLSHVKVELRNYINKKKSEGIEVNMYLIGHSYGGFTSIQLADYFSSYFAGLVTIDPISMLKCQAKDMATKIYSTVTMKHEGCLTAPNDKYSSESIKKIRSDITKSNSKKWWYHTYQNAFPWLRSGEIKSNSGVNPVNRLFTREDFKSAIADGDYHSQMGRNEKLWDLITMQFANRVH